MKKSSIYFLLLLSPGLSFAQVTENAAQVSSKMTTGLSLALIIVLALLVYALIEKGKLHKRNQDLARRIQELEK